MAATVTEISTKRIQLIDITPEEAQKLITEQVNCRTLAAHHIESNYQMRKITINSRLMCTELGSALCYKVE